MDAPQLMRLDEALRSAGLVVTPSFVKSVRVKAKRLNQCFIIARRYYVTTEQLGQILETYRWQGGNGEGAELASTWLKRQRQASTKSGVRYSGSPSERVRSRLTLVLPSKCA